MCWYKPFVRVNHKGGGGGTLRAGSSFPQSSASQSFLKVASAETDSVAFLYHAVSCWAALDTIEIEYCLFKFFLQY